MKPNCLKSFEEMEKEMQSISYQYFAAKRDETKKKLCDNINSSFSFSSLYASRVHSAFFNLNDEEKMIINKDFFYEDYKDWWLLTYTKKMYLNKKKEAMRKFLTNFYEID